MLIHPPTQGKAIIDTLYRLAHEPSFPEDPDQAYTILKSTDHLGQAKQSAVRNFCILLVKRLFKSEERVSSDLGNRIVAALVAVSRIDPPIFLSTIKDTLNNLLVGAEDRFIRRLFLLARHYPAMWDDLRPAAQVRMVNVIQEMSAGDLIKFGVPTTAATQDKIAAGLRERLDLLELDDRKSVLKTKPSIALKKLAISTFVASGSFDSAYANGDQILLLYASFFDFADLTEILDGARNNAAWRGLNQILPAGGMDSVLSALFDKTKAIPKAGDIWVNFWNEMPQYWRSYPDLRARLEGDALIQPKPVENEVDEDLPF